LGEEAATFLLRRLYRWGFLVGAAGRFVGSSLHGFGVGFIVGNGNWILAVVRGRVKAWLLQRKFSTNDF